ncbi:hypothetical protein ONZ45_g15142 [Pleurotus djamor]|nr:hypothetical protein ONZ45_g15142 [Pleurotus djamor]
MSSLDTSGLRAITGTLTGTNWQTWSEKMTHLLRAKGVWLYVNGTITKPSPIAATPARGDNPATPGNASEVNQWLEKDQMALGIIALTVSENLQRHIKDTSKETWDTLKTAFSSTTVSAAYQWLQTLLNFRIKSTENPTPVLEKFRTAVQHLEKLKLVIPSSLLALITLTALPKEWEFIAQMTITKMGTDASRETVQSLCQQTLCC